MTDWMDEAYAPIKLIHSTSNIRKIETIPITGKHCSLGDSKELLNIFSEEDYLKYLNDQNYMENDNILTDQEYNVFDKIANKDSIDIDNIKNAYEKEWLKLACENAHIDAVNKDEIESIQKHNELKRVVAYLRYKNCNLTDQIARINAELKVIVDNDKEKDQRIKQLNIDWRKYRMDNSSLEKKLKVKTATIESLCCEGKRNQEILRATELTLERTSEEHCACLRELREIQLSQESLCNENKLIKSVIETAKQHFKRDYNALNEKYEHNMNEQKMTAAKKYEEYEKEISQLKFLNKGLKDGFEKLKCHVKI